jgi:hypothetical protein
VHAPVLIREEEVVEVELSMAVEAIPLDPLVILGRRQIRQGTLDEFYDRMARMKQRGKGRFLTREQIEARSGGNLAMLLQTLPGVWLKYRGNSVELINPRASGGIFCTPEYFLDGLPMLGGLREIYVLDLEGVEVYRGYSEAIHGYFPHGCGQIFLWRKSDWGNPITWKRSFLFLGLLALVLIL